MRLEANLDAAWCRGWKADVPCSICHLSGYTRAYRSIDAAKVRLAFGLSKPFPQVIRQIARKKSVHPTATEISLMRARIYTGVLHSHLHPSATMVSFTGFVGHVCPPFGHTCPTRPLPPQSFFVRPLPFPSLPWWLKGEGRSAKPLCNARARVDAIIKVPFDRETKRPRFVLIARANAS